MRAIVVSALLSLLMSVPAGAQRRAERFVVAVDTPAKEVTVTVPEERTGVMTIGQFGLTGVTAGAMLGLIVSSVVCAFTTPQSRYAWEDDEEEPCPFTKWVWGPPLVGAAGGGVLGTLAGVLYVAGQTLFGAETASGGNTSEGGEAP